MVSDFISLKENNTLKVLCFPKLDLYGFRFHVTKGKQYVKGIVFSKILMKLSRTFKCIFDYLI